MTPVVIDTSVAVKWIIAENERYVDQADNVRSHIKDNVIRCYAPQLLLYEIGNVMISKQCTTSYMMRALKMLHSLPITFAPCDFKLAISSMKISKENYMTFYDASFIALAKSLKANLVTDNIKHHGKYRGKEVKIIALKDYR